MKKFLKFLVAVLVIFIIIGTTFVLIKESRRYKSMHPDEPEIMDIEEKDVVVCPNIEKEPIYIIQVISGETVSGEIQLLSGEQAQKAETFSSKEELIDSINRIEENNISAKVTNTIQDRVGEEVVGSKYAELFELLNTSTTSTTIQIAGSMIYIIPASDFLDSQQFHYDEEGNLVLYVVEGAGTGFKTRYYIANETLIEKVGEDVGEIYSGENIESGEEMILDETDLQDVYTRAKNLYSEYLKK